MISPYIQNVKNWKIREMAVRFLEAKATFETHNKPLDSGEIIAFGILRKICDMLYEIKEDHHLIFKKIINPKKRTFEDANKFTPNEGEINFGNNVGLLFHKILVARELKYMLDYYEEDSTGYLDTKTSLDRNLDRIQALFTRGIEILQTMLRSHTNNIYLITYFVENQEFCTNQFKLEPESLLRMITDQEYGLEEAYLAAAKYYRKSGWHDKAKAICEKNLQLHPQNIETKKLLESL